MCIPDKGIYFLLPADMSCLAYLKTLSVGQNLLTGQLNYQWMTFWPSMQNMNLSHNMFSGTLPPGAAWLVEG